MRFSQSTHHKNWLTYSGGTDRPGELCYNFLNSYDLDCDPQSSALMDLLISSNPSVCSTVAFPPLRYFYHVSQLSLTFLQTQKDMPLFIVSFMTILVVIGKIFVMI